jgi:hypothetical protein
MLGAKRQSGNAARAAASSAVAVRRPEPPAGVACALASPAGALRRPPAVCAPAAALNGAAQ